MGKIKNIVHNLPLGISYTLCVAVFALLAAFLSVMTSNWSEKKIFAIEKNYSLEDDTVSHEGATGADIVYFNFKLSEPKFSPEDVQAYRSYQRLRSYGPVFWAVICLLCSGILFYYLTLKKPLYLLKKASAHLAQNDLEFEIQYEGSNEMAGLCTSFEKMRTSLRDNNRKMQGMIEQRKRLNDAYTHELRNPVAVLRGYSDMILKYLPEQQMPEDELLDAVRIMSEHVARIDAFTESMNTIQKLEDITVCRKETDSQYFFGILKKSARILCQSREVSIKFRDLVQESKLFVDTDAVLQVFENVLGNALQYAGHKISITADCKEGMLQLVFCDDGKGFSEEELEKAGLCYYSGKDSEGGHHFGLGLYITALLCEKHGGRLELANTEEGGAKVLVSFYTYR